MIVSQLDPRGNVLDRLVFGWVHTIRWTLSFLSVALNDSAHAPTQSRPRTPHRGVNTIGVEVVQEPLRRGGLFMASVEGAVTCADASVG